MSLLTSFMILDLTSARAQESQTATGQIAAISHGGVGAYIDEEGGRRRILTSRLLNELESQLSVIYTISPEVVPEAGADYVMGTAGAVGATGVYTAHWLARQHLEGVGTPLEYWLEHQAVQLCIWNVGGGFDLSPSRVPDQVVLARARELCAAADAADPEGNQEYFSEINRQIYIRLSVRRATATRVFLEATLKDAEDNKGITDRMLAISYDGVESQGTTGEGGVLRVDYERSDETVQFDAQYATNFNPGNAWISADGTQPPIVSGDKLPATFFATREIQPKDLASKEDLAFQSIGRVVGVTGATVSLILVVGGWLINFSISIAAFLYSRRATIAAERQ
ncbi:hypothetical protein ACI79P_05110 [Blastococcus sp. SYSU DS0510]